VGDEVIVEVKAVARMDPIFQAKLMSYLPNTRLRAGLLINFNVPLLKEGIQRIVLWPSTAGSVRRRLQYRPTSMVTSVTSVAKALTGAACRAPALGNRSASC
jgi:hypothetical protein